MKKFLLGVLAMSLAVLCGWYVESLERKVSELQSHASTNSMQINRVSMTLQMFYEMAPDEIVRMVRANRCQCGHDTPSRTIASQD